MEVAWILVPVALGFAIAFFAGAALLPVLARFQFRQHAYEDAPQTHQKKTGTPTMGGIVFAAALLPMFAFSTAPFTWPLLFLIVACAGIGFADDFMSIKRGRNLGLRARTKYLLTALAAIVFLFWTSSTNALFPRDVILHAGTYALQVPHWLWLALGILAVTGTIHAVNLTDGLDGLATGTVLPPLAVLATIGLGSMMVAPAWTALLEIGACAGFLVYNRHPARMFMGDTGSLALGALLSGIAILEGEMLLLIVLGGVFVAEAVSVILQVGYFKATKGKRLFKMSPLHHHFELLGWPETKVTARFWIASLILAIAGWAIARGHI